MSNLSITPSTNFCTNSLSLLRNEDEVDKCQLENGTLVDLVTVIQEYSTPPADDYFNGYVLGLNKDPNGTLPWKDTHYTFSDYGYPRWQLVLCLLLAWILVMLSLIKGLQSLGKV